MKLLRPNNSLLHPLFAPVVLAAVIFAVYFPAMTSGIHTIDDPGIISLFSSPPPLLDILLPGRGSHYYYRPLVQLSYYLDSRLWGMEPSVMHLENVLLHLANTYLVFLIGGKIAVHFRQPSPLVPVLAALLFALHPLNVEVVSWISGRTDALAAVFLLSACFFWISWIEGAKWHHAVCAGFLFCLGAMTKEAAVAFLPGSLLLLRAWPAAPDRRKKVAAGSIVAFVIVVLVAVPWSLPNGVQSVARFLASDHVNAAGWWRTSIIAFGFYLKKLLLPLPLNFAIDAVNPGYGMLGVAGFIAFSLVLSVRRITTLFFALSVLMILPALILANKPIAWTPFAERYMYMPTAFACLGLASLLFSLHSDSLNRLAPLILVVVCLAGVVSFERTLLWRDKLAFYQDAVSKSPGFGSVRNELGGQYLLHRQNDSAAAAFAAADQLNKRPSMKMLIRKNVMATMVAKDDYLAARDYFFRQYQNKNDAPADFLEVLYVADSKRLESLPVAQRGGVAYDLLETVGLLYQKKPDPFWLYRSGQIAVAAGDTERAAQFFRQAYLKAPVDAYYKAAARTNQLKLEARK